MPAFFLECEPPTVTEQMHRFGGRRKNGQVIVYRDARLEAARELFLRLLRPHAPKTPLEGPVFLSCTWFYSTKRRDRDGCWKTTKPDTDNAMKLFRDCMTLAGFWRDDAQVALERTAKVWAMKAPGILVEVNELAKWNEDPFVYDGEAPEGV